MFKFQGLKFLYLTKTRIANPSEWNGLTEQNEKIYVRFSNGELRVGSGETLNEARLASRAVYSFDRDELDYLSTEELQKIMSWRKTIIEPKYSQIDYDS